MIIVQGQGQKKTQLYPNKDIEGRLLYGFDDAFCTNELGIIDNNIKLYYGTGTEWVSL